MKTKIKVVPGSIIVNSVYIIYQSKGCIALSVDCRSKYPECSDGEDSKGNRELLLYYGPETLNRNLKKESPTKISVQKLDGDQWRSTLSVGRYSVFWVLVKYPPEEERELVYDRFRKVKKSPRKRSKSV